jgi:hypothetical protein
MSLRRPKLSTTKGSSVPEKEEEAIKSRWSYQGPLIFLSLYK